MQGGLFHKKGAEAELSCILADSQNALSKKRVPKSYRDAGLDASIRKQRTRAEAKLLKQAAAVVNAPKIMSVDEEKSEIVMEFITGKPLKEVIEKMPALCVEAGKCIRKLHDIGIIHGDLTTSNIIFCGEPESKELSERIASKGPLFFVDFGLGFFSKKLEDKATDIVVFKKTFNATHSAMKKGWALVMEGYSPDKGLKERMKAIEKRARYH